MCKWKEGLVKQGEAGSSLITPLVRTEKVNAIVTKDKRGQLTMCRDRWEARGTVMAGFGPPKAGHI